ncbi:MAG TPA: hypothetical protein VGD49_15630 [Longimicrobiales bacterium]
MTREQKIALTGVVATVVAFAAGFFWQNMRARSLQDKLDTANVELTFKRLEATLAAATIEADRGNYEIARQCRAKTARFRVTDRAVADSRVAIVPARCATVASLLVDFDCVD